MHTHVWGRREDFTLYGRGSISPTLGPGRSVYLAQPLANKGIAVLQVGPPPPGSSTHPFDEAKVRMRSEEHTSELQSLMRISYAVFCLKKTKKDLSNQIQHIQAHNIT